ncbi:MAG: PQQ-binding-like beta-propeller repeat protein [Candidatus Lokiarchaeia archaeon]
MKRKILTLLTCVLLLAAFSIPLVQNSTSTSVSQNNIFSQIATTSNAGGSIEWSISLNNAVGRSIAVTPDESYIFIAGANWTDPTNTSTWKPTLWKYNNTGGQEWNTTLNIQGSTSVAFKTLALSSDGSSIYAGGLIPNATNYYDYDMVVVKFNASDRSYIWNYTLNDPYIDNIYALKVSPDDKMVYFAGSISKPDTYIGNTSFYVGAINTTNGALEWEYDLFKGGAYNYGYARDLTLSPSGEVLYAAGYHRAYNSLNTTTFVALNTTTRSQLWNITSTTYHTIYYIDITSDGNSIYSISSAYPNYQLLTINTSNGNIMENLSISNMYDIRGLSLSFNESILYVLTRDLKTFGQTLRTLMVELNFSGTVTSVLLAPNNQLVPYDFAPSKDNVSVYIAASTEFPYSDVYSMWLIKGQAGPIPLPPLILLILFNIMSSQTQMLPTQMSNTLIGIGIAVALVLVGFLVSKILRGGLKSG